MEVRLLGPFEVHVDGRPVDAGTPRQRAVLALLALNADRVVSVDRLVEGIWGARPPAAVHTALQAYISNLRRLLEPGRRPREPARVLVTEAPGYVLRVVPDDVDAHRFELAVALAESDLAAGRVARAWDGFAGALGLWRGDPLGGFAYDPFAAAEIDRLQEWRLRAEAGGARAMAAGGDAVGALAAIEATAEAHPFREDLRALQMQVLYRAGRQADALAVFDATRRRLADELGLEPGPQLQQLQLQILRHDPDLQRADQADADRPAPIAAGATLAAGDPPTSPATTGPPIDAPTAAAGSAPRFVGRLDALAASAGALAAAAAGHTGVLIVSGEPGIGKTRLVEEAFGPGQDGTAALGSGPLLGDHGSFASERAPGPVHHTARIVWARCHEDDGAPPMWPWRQVLRQLPAGEGSLGLPDTSLHDMIGRGVASRPGPSDGSSTDRSADDGAVPPTEAPDERDRFRLYEAIAHTLRDAAGQRPLVVVIDDVQWADVSSLRLLRFLLVELQSAPLLLAMTLRDVPDPAGVDATNPGVQREVLAALLADLARHRRVTRLALEGLSHHDIVAYVEPFVGSVHAASVADDIHRRTSGNSFFVTELVRLGSGDGSLRSADGRQRLPVAVSDVVRRRVDRLGAPATALLATAAAIGGDVEVTVLAVAHGLELHATLDALEPSVRAGVLIPVGVTTVRFAHALVGEALVDDLSAANRAHLHGRIGAAIEAVHAARLEAHAAALAHHFGAAAPLGEGARALRYARLAAEQAERQLAFDEAAHHLADALALLAEEPHAGGAEADAAERARLLANRADCLQRAGRVTEAVAARDEALALAVRVADEDLLAQVALGYGKVGLWQARASRTVHPGVVAVLEQLVTGRADRADALTARLRAGLAVALYYGDPDGERGRQLAHRALDDAARLGDAPTLANLLAELHALDDPAAIDAAQRLLGRPDHGLPALVVASTRVRLARACLAAGQPVDLAAEADAAIEAARRDADPPLRVWATWLRGTAAFLDGQLDRALDLAAEAVDGHEQLGFWGGPDLYALQHVLVRREEGRLAELAPLLQAQLHDAHHDGGRATMAGIVALESGGPAAVRALPFELTVPAARDFTWLGEMALLAELAAAADLPCRAAVFDLLLPLADRVVTLSAYACLGSVSHHLGLLAASLGRHDAVDWFRRAVAVNERIGAVPWTVRSTVALVEALAVGAGPVTTDGEVDRLWQRAAQLAERCGLVAMQRRLASLRAVPEPG